MVSRVVHFEIPVDDPERESRFYGRVFGWNVARWGPEEYWPMTTGGQAGPGAEGALTRRSEAAVGVLVSIGVDDVDASLARVAEEGGTVVAPRTPIPGVGWSATFRDPDGNLIGLFQDDPGADGSPAA